MNSIDDNLDFSQKRPFISLPPEDPYEKIRVIEDRKQYECKFAKHLISQVKKIKVKNNFRSISICLGNDNIDQNIITLTKIFYKNLEKGSALQNLEFNYESTKMEDLGTSKLWYASFDTYSEKLLEYLEDYIKTGGLQDTTITLLEPNYGFYVSGIRNKCYRITQRGRGNKSFSLICSLVNNMGGLPASKLAKSVGTRSNKVSDMRKQINDQFKKHCGLFHDVIVLNSEGNYRISDKFLIKEARNPLALEKK